MTEIIINSIISHRMSSVELCLDAHVWSGQMVPDGGLDHVCTVALGISFSEDRSQIDSEGDEEDVC